MPPLKQVKKLSDMCIWTFNKAVIEYINNHNFWSEALEAQMSHTYLGNINPLINERLLNNIDENVLQNELEKITLIKFYRNCYIKEFNLKFKLPNTLGFYEEYLLGLNKLVVLNLTKVCTDEILKVVGENCPLLEVIYIISKTESVSNKSRRSLNALKLKFFISDEGLEQLHKCKYLKKIYMDKIIRSSCGGRKVTHKGIRSLLSSLPSLRYISYEDMGRVLEEWGQICRPLSLFHIHDNHITPEHISIFNKFCPFLQTLCLAIPTVVQDPGISQECLHQLSKSNIALQNLVLKSFPFDMILENFLTIKGNNLVTLSLEHDSITTKSLFTIGTKCKNLENLSIKLLHPNPSDFKILLTPDDKCFEKLKIFRLFGINWNPHVIFTLCLYNAKHIESIVLYNKNYSSPTDEIFEKLSMKNGLSNLSKLCLLDGFNLNVNGLVNFVLRCKKLQEIIFTPGSNYSRIFEEIIKKYNYDLIVKCDNIGSYSYCFCQN